MFRSLRMRIALILSLLIISVMVVVGTFLLNSVSNFYHDDFKKQMTDVFSNEDFLLTLSTASKGDFSYTKLYEILRAYAGKLGIDTYRDFYILNGKDAAFLAGSNSVRGSTLERTPNVIRAMSGNTGEEVSKSSNYLDYAMPVKVDGAVEYIIYVKDTKEELQQMIWMLFAIIIQALLFAMLIAVIMSFFLAKAITNPVDSITKGAQLIASGDFDYKLPVRSKDEIGTLTQTFNNMADVLKNTMGKIEEERNKLQTIFLYLTDGVVAFTKEGSLLHINHAAEQMLMTDGETKPTFDEMFSNFGIDIQVNNILNADIGSNLIKDITVRGRTLKLYFAGFDAESKDGNEFTGGIIVVIHDVTEQQKFEQSRREFVANVSHELRTPLTNIKSYTETIMESDNLPQDILQRFLGVIINQTDRMTRIVKDLLVLSRLDNNKMDWVFAPMKIGTLLDNIYDSMLMDAKNHNHELTLDVENELGTMVGDKDRIEQVVINIVSNAIKYTHDGGQIRISAHRDDDLLTILVKDNGIGIPKQDIPRLFERFYRVDKARSRESGGTGLGLAIAKEIITAHGGKIDISSQPGKGTTVTIYLPCNLSGPQNQTY